MSPAVTNYLVARDGAHVYVRVTGLANMKNAPVLDAYLNSELERHAELVCVELGQCGGMDSTFMGLLVGFGTSIGLTGGKLVVVNPGVANLKLLRLLGINEVLPILDGCELPELRFVTLACQADQNQLMRMQLIKRAHENLVALNDTNKTKFSQFLAALDKDLVKHAEPKPD